MTTIYPTPPARRFDASRAVWAILLLIPAACIYWQTHRFDFLSYDDGTYVTFQPHVDNGLSWTNFKWAITAFVVDNWHPLTMWAEMTLVSLFTVKAAAFHLASAAGHLVNVVLLFYFLCHATGKTGRSLAVTALWAYHPLRVESVAWIAELKDVLGGMMTLGCLLAYTAYSRKRDGARYAAVLVLACLAFMSKPSTVTLPFMLLLLDYWPLERSPSDPPAGLWWTHRVLEKLPLFLLSAGVATIGVLRQIGPGRGAGIFRYLPWSVRLGNAVTAYAAYIRDSLLPTHLGIIYPHPYLIAHPLTLTAVLAAVAVLVAISVAAGLFARTKPYLIVGWCWFLGVTFPMIGLLQSGEQARADRFTYVSGIGLTIALVFLIADVLPRRRTLGWVVGSAAALVLSVAAYWQTSYWFDNRTIFGHSAAVIPDDFIALTTLAAESLQANDKKAALSYALAAVAASPTRTPEPHRAYAGVLAALDRNREALEEYKTAIRISPNEYFLRVDTAIFLYTRRPPFNEEAIIQLGKALELNPELSNARSMMAELQARQGRLNEAIGNWEIVTRVDPKFPTVQGHLAEALRLTGDKAGAIRHFQAALAYGDDNPLYKSTLAYLLATDANSTPEQLQAAVPLAEAGVAGRKTADAYSALSLVLARLNRFDEAKDAIDLGIAAATAEHNPELVEVMRRRRDAFAAGNPFPASTRPATTPATTLP